MSTEEQRKRQRKAQARYRQKHGDRIREADRIRQAHLRKSDPEKCREIDRRSKTKHKDKICAKRREKYRLNEKFREAQSERARKWREENPKKESVMKRLYYERNKEKIKAFKRAYYSKNSAKVKSRVDRYYQANRERYRAAQRRRMKDPRRRIRMALCIRIHRAIKKSMYGIRTMTMLGCPLKDFLIYLESKFEVGMTWENYGSVWHVDHIMPCAIFDLTKPEHQKRCFHFSNLQPLFGRDNLRKGAKIVTNQYNLL